MKVLGIETSCDETAASVVENGKRILSNSIKSSILEHKKYGGVIPEIASRMHVEVINYVIEDALKLAKIKLKDIGLIATTFEPGLPGSLLIGTSFAKAMSFALGLPLVEVNHIHAHLYSSFLNPNRVYPAEQIKSLTRFNLAALRAKNDITFLGLTENIPELPFIGLVISGGHSSIFKVEKGFRFKLLISTQDDALGEAFDKVAKILGLPYPGGPIVEKLAKKGNENSFKFVAWDPDNKNFSFSGIKTAVLYKVKQFKKITKAMRWKNDVAASFQKEVVDIVVKKSISACLRQRIKHLVIGGGVASNCYLRDKLQQEASANRIKLYIPEKSLCLDNAAMIAGLGYQIYINS